MPHLEAPWSTFVGQSIETVPKPAIVLDSALVRQHCRDVLDAVKALGVGFRAHVKTHKTVELARLQQDDGPGDVKFIASTVAEIEHLLPLLMEYKSKGRRVNILYGIPLPPSATPRLAELAQKLGPDAIAVMVDHPTQLSSLSALYSAAKLPVGVYVKVDTGYHRAGLPPTALNKGGLLDRLLELDLARKITFLGLYSHSSLSYAGSSPKEAMDSLAGEIEGCVQALKSHCGALTNHSNGLTVSVGASPQVISIQNFAGAKAGPNLDAAHLLETIRDVTLGTVGECKVALELHAGVYSVLDMQQLETRARGLVGSVEDEVATFVVAEVCSVYNDGERRHPEALVAVGTLGLGREPCHSYEGWGVVGSQYHPASEEKQRRLIVDRISQEHSIVSWELGPEERDGNATLPPIPLEPGQTVRVYPNHACVAGAMYPWYLVVDSGEDEKAYRIVDVWVRAVGW